MLKVGFALLLASVSISLTYAMDICEYQLNGTRLAHPADCNKFVVCKDGQTESIRNCPIGLHFNRFKSVCDIKERAACEYEFMLSADKELHCSACCAVCGCDCLTPTRGPPTPGPPTPVTPCTPTPETPGPPTPETPDTPTPETPGTSTLEPPGTPTPETPGTPTPETPSPPTPETPGTPTPKTPATPTPETPGTPTPETPGTPTSKCDNNSTACVGKPSGSVSYVNGTCNQYIVCVGDCVNILSCPSNLQYNLTTNRCDSPQNVNCPWQSPPPIAGPSGVTCAQHGGCLGKPDGTLLPDPNSNGYIICQCECEMRRPCAAGTRFDKILQVCVHIDSGTESTNGNKTENVNGSGNGGGNLNDGGNGSGNVANNSNGTTTICINNNIKDCQNQTDGTLLSVDGQCNKFYTCSNGCAVENICPNNLIYNPTKEYCDYQQNYKCPWLYKPPSGPAAGPSGIACANGERCIDKADGTFFSSINNNQSKYVICQCECEVEMNCPAGLVWDMQKLTCNWPSSSVLV